MIVITHNDIYNTSGGLERAAKTFITWIERGGDPVNYFFGWSFLNKINLIRSHKRIFLIGHRSIPLLFWGLFFYLIGKHVIWCAFWHDHKLEKTKNHYLYELFDVFFRKIYNLSDLMLVVSEHERVRIVRSEHFAKIKLATVVNIPVSMMSGPRDIDVLIVGRDVPHKRMNLIRKLKVETNLSVFELITNKLPVSEKKLMDTYCSAKTVMVPSLYESYSLVALEALSCGCNVVVAPGVMIKDHFEDYANFIVLNDDIWAPKNILKVIEQLQEISQNLQVAVNVQNKFSDESCSKDFLEKIQRV